jgi:predicted phosphodiesterase
MSKRILMLALAVVLIASPSFAWKFASMADSRGDDNGVNTKVFDKIIDRINSEGVDLVIFQGDAVSGSSDDVKLGEQMDNWLACMKRLNAPWYYTPGNHEIHTATAQSRVLRAKVSQPLNGPLGDWEMTYSFDHKNAHFVALNSDHFGGAHEVSADWMASDLAKTSKTHVFVMAHDPAYPAGPHKGSSLDSHPEARDDFWAKMTAGRVSMYFCGHEHLYQRTRQGSIIQVINGSCGAPLYKDETSISKYHYVIVDIEGSKVFCKAKDEDGVVLDSWNNDR